VLARNLGGDVEQKRTALSRKAGRAGVFPADL